MPVFWDQKDLQPLRNTSMAEKLSGKWPMKGCQVEPPTQVLMQPGRLQACASIQATVFVGQVLGEDRTPLAGVCKIPNTPSGLATC